MSAGLKSEPLFFIVEKEAEIIDCRKKCILLALFI